MNIEPNLPDTSNMLDFRGIIHQYIQIEHLIPRRWLINAVEDALNLPQKQFILMTESPGFGKSTLVAQLAEKHPDWIIYFIRSNQKHLFGKIDQKYFLAQIGYQLAIKNKNLFTLDKIRVKVRQEIGKNEEGGQVEGIVIENFVTSPLSRIAPEIELEITQFVVTNQGEVVALRINNYVEKNLYEYSLDVLEEITLFGPARKLLHENPHQKIVILIDALDEIFYRGKGSKEVDWKEGESLENDRQDSILDWLTDCQQLPENIQFILTSRQKDKKIEDFCKIRKTILYELPISEFKEKIREEIHDYAQNYLLDQGMCEFLDHEGYQFSKIQEQIAQKADDNIGFLVATQKLLKQAIQNNDSETLREVLSGNLTGELSDLYQLFLSNVFRLLDRKGRPEISGQLHMLLGCLCVQQDVLTAGQYEFINDYSEDNEFAEVKSYIDQFLVKEQRDGVDAYRLFHKSFIDFMTSLDTKNKRETTSFYIHPPKWNTHIVKAYLKKHKHLWLACTDLYPLRYLLSHACASIGHIQQVAEVLQDFTFLEAVTIKFGVEYLIGELRESNGFNITTDFNDLPIQVQDDTKFIEELTRAIQCESHVIKNWPYVIGLRDFFYQQVINRACSMRFDEVQKRIGTSTSNGPRERVFFDKKWANNQVSTEPWKIIEEDGSQVFCMAVAPGNPSLLIASFANQSLYVWNLDTGQSFGSMPKPGNVIHALAQLNTHLFLAATCDAQLSLWDCCERRILAQENMPENLQKPSAIFHKVLVSPKQQHGLVIEQGERLFVWHLDLHKEPQLTYKTVLTKKGYLIKDAIWLDDTRIVAAYSLAIFEGADDRPKNLVIIWDLNLESEVEQINSRKAISCLAYLPEAQILAWGTHLGASDIVLWDVVHHRRLEVMAEHDRFISALATIPKQKRLVSGSEDNTLLIWDLSSPEPKLHQRLLGHRAAITAITLVGNRTLISASENGEVRSWDLALKECTHEFTGLHGRINELCCAVGEDQQVKFIAASQERRISIWDTKNFHKDGIIASLKKTQQPVSVLAASPKAHEVLIGLQNGDLQILEACPPYRINILDSPHQWGISAVAISRDGGLALTGSNSSHIALWNLAERHLVSCRSCQAGSINGLGFLSDSLIVVSTPRNLQLWDTESLDGPTILTDEIVSNYRKETWPLRRPLNVISPISVNKAMALSADGMKAVVARSDGSIALWDLFGRKKIKQIERPLGGEEDSQPQGIRALMALPTGQLVIAGESSTLSIMDENCETTVCTISNFGKPVTALAYLGQGEVLLITDKQGALRAWTWKKGARLIAEGRVEVPLSSIAVLPSGEMITANELGELSLYCFQGKP